MIQVVITKEEQKAIKSLQRLAKSWPESLILFSWSGSLVVMREVSDRRADVASVHGIRNDGGDPDHGEGDGAMMDADEYEIVYEGGL